MSNSATERARHTYNVAHWSEGYFDVDEQGSLTANPTANSEGHSIPLPDLVEDIRAHGLSLPILIRFTDILYHRVDTLIRAFEKAKQDCEYPGGYTAVYPIKVNQQRSVVEKLLSHTSGKVGLEAGSKPELLAILGVSDTPITIVCNGYKDREFIRLALIGQKMGHTVNIVVEKLSELNKVLEEAADLEVEPRIGIRIRLNSTGKGKWQNTGGEKGKFGLAAHQVLEAVERLKAMGKEQYLCLVHFHIGSQVANIRDIQKAIHECARYYAELRHLGVPIDTVDVGGGLGVDYEGSRSRHGCSVNYTPFDYANRVVHELDEICYEHGLPHPNIISESGRSMTAHHAVLVANVIDNERQPKGENLPEVGDEAPSMIYELWQCHQRVDAHSALEAYHEAMYCIGEAASQFSHGMLNISQWAQAEQIYFAICHEVRKHLKHSSRAHREVLDELNEKLADKLFCNFSLFQSLPDIWGIQQLFPVMPLQGMDRPLTDRAIIQDITCDSDGQIRQYVDGAGIEASLPMPKAKQDEEQLLGFFMVGAYQEILGDLHNLFGDTDSVHVELTDDGYSLSRLMKGDTAAQVLDYVHFEPRRLVESYRRQLAKVGNRKEVNKLLIELEAGVSGYTYFED
ncbi:biosynthetic arginine decarboxylase [Corallincola luteus]|uniref:Biosynthetic arginine decarboxylase n=1 Tax=Corallincola luteus TaxID=1775177 RepID=A0ABY2AK73_9GAMM|nr:biosynthetic arginine decarboxylase [Corallincola luteus]TCI02680.1 biosynthetic arginine decarboxylase [Corallincola luteus]